VSLLGVHVGFAAFVTTIALVWSSWPTHRRWTVIAVSAFWAIIPDAYHAIPGTESWYKPLVHDSFVADVFWFHRVIDRLDPGDRPIFSVVVLSAFGLCFLLVEVLPRREQASAGPT
jgi:hypothetical protein